MSQYQTMLQWMMSIRVSHFTFTSNITEFNYFSHIGSCTLLQWGCLKRDLKVSMFFVFVLRKTPALTNYDLRQESTSMGNHKQAESTDTEAHVLGKTCTASTLESNNIGKDLSWVWAFEFHWLLGKELKNQCTKSVTALGCARRDCCWGCVQIIGQ